MNNLKIVEQDNEYRDSICKNHMNMHLECINDRPKLSLTFLSIATMHCTKSRVFKAHINCDSHMLDLAEKEGKKYVIPDFKHHNVLHEMILNYWITSNAILACQKLMKPETLNSVLNGAFNLLDQHHHNCFTVASEHNGHSLRYNEIIDGVNGIDESADGELGIYWANLLFEEGGFHPFFPIFLELSINEAIQIQKQYFEKSILNTSSTKSKLMYKFFDVKLY